MFKCYDKIVGEIIEAETKEILLNAINDRWETYNNYLKILTKFYCFRVADGVRPSVSKTR